MATKKRPDNERGLYGKYRISRRDGSSRTGGKHEHCQYFVLDTRHDPYAALALRAYADACEATHPMLARDLRAWAEGGFRLGVDTYEAMRAVRPTGQGCVEDRR